MNVLWSHSGTNILQAIIVKHTCKAFHTFGANLIAGTLAEYEEIYMDRCRTLNVNFRRCHARDLLESCLKIQSNINDFLEGFGTYNNGEFMFGA